MLKEWLYIAGLLMTIFFYLNTSQHNAVVSCWNNKFVFLKNRYYISHVVNFGASLKFDDVMLTARPLYTLHQKSEMWSRPSPLNSLGVSQTTTLFMISTGQVTNKKSAMDEPHYWLARGKLRGMCREPAIYTYRLQQYHFCNFFLLYVPGKNL